MDWLGDWRIAINAIWQARLGRFGLLRFRIKAESLLRRMVAPCAEPGRARGAKGRAKTVVAAKTAGSKVKKKAEKSTTVVAAKYRGPEGEAWTGRGLMPRWLAALVAQGRTKEEFAIKN